MIKRIFAVGLILLCLPFFSEASTITCGSSIGGSGTELFAFNTSWYGHACKITPSGNIDVTAVSAEISRIATDQTFNLEIESDASGKPSGTVLASGSISSTIANCHVYTGTFATTTLTSGTSYWLVAEPTTHSTAYICGAGSATVSDKDSSNVWANAYTGGYYLAATFSSSTSSGGGSGGGVAGSSTALVGLTVSTSSATVTYDPAQVIFNGIFLFISIFGLLIFYLR